jgi:hypothetical protein
MASPIEATLILCDAAQADAFGKLHILGAGWSMTSSPTPPSAVAVLLKIPGDRANQQLPTSLLLQDADGRSVKIEDVEVGIRNTVEVGRPPGIEPGSSIDASFQLTLPALPLAPGRYRWHLQVSDSHESVGFLVRAAQPPS